MTEEKRGNETNEMGEDETRVVSVYTVSKEQMV